MEEETFIPAENLMATMDLEGWDNLVNRGTKSEALNKWERESLFLKFDPMLVKPTIPEELRNEQFKLPGSSNDGLRQCNPSTISSVETSNIASEETFYSSTSCSSVELNVEGQKMNIIENSGTNVNIMSPSLSNNFMEMNGTENHKDNEDSTANQEENFSRQLQEKQNKINEVQTNLEEQEGPRLSIIENTGTSVNIMSPFMSNNFMEMNGTENHKDNEDSTANQEEDFSWQLQEKPNPINELQNVEKTGTSVNIMSPSLSNNFMEMNGTGNHKDNEDSTANQEEDFSRQLQEKQNHTNELQIFLEEQEGPRLSKIENTRTNVNILLPSLSNNFMEMNGTDNHKDNEDSTANQEEDFSRQLQEKENHINELQKDLEELKSKSNSESSYSRVLSEYEKTISMYIQKVDELKEKLNISESEKRHLIQERDQALEDLRNVESAFSDVHRKYERSKGLLENFKSNEATLLRRDQETTQKLQRRDKAIEDLKAKAQESLEQMHLDYENKIQDYESENVRLRAQFRKMEMKLDSLESDVEQKSRENAQLSALCDELINGQVVN